MTREQHLFTILAEECNETAQRVSKALRFGLQEVQPGQSMTNEQRLVEEYFHIKAAMEMLTDDGIIQHISKEHKDMLISSKKAQVEKYLEYSKKFGTLNQ